MNFKTDFICKTSGKIISNTASNDSNAIVSTSGDVTNIPLWNMQALVAEFSSDDSNKILIKMSRNWIPICLRYGLLLGSVALLSLSAFAIDVKSLSDKLGIVIGLVLALIFVELPDIPVVTFVHKYHYTMFSFLFAVALQMTLATDGLFEVSESQWVVLLCFLGLYALLHFVFAVSSVITANGERQKIYMNSEQISELLQHNINMSKINVSGATVDLELRTNQIILKGTYPYFCISINIYKKYLGTSEPIVIIKELKNESLFDYFGFENWWRVTVIEWLLLFIIVLLEFSIGLSQLIAYQNFECVHENSSIIELFFFSCFVCIAFTVILFMYLVVNISRILYKSLVFILYVVLCITFCLEIDFFAVFTNCKILDFNAIFSWWMLSISIVIFVIGIIYHFFIEISSNFNAVQKRRGETFSFIAIFNLHFIAMIICIYHWVLLRSNTFESNCIGNKNKIFSLNIAMVVGTVIAQLYFVMVWMFTRMFVDEDIINKKYVTEVILVSWMSVLLAEVGVSVHGFIFWLFTMLGKIESDVECIPFSFMHKIILLVLHVIWIILCCGCIFYFIYLLLKSKFFKG